MGALLTVAGATTAAAQAVPGFDSVIAERQERIGATHLKFVGGVEFKRADTELYADEVEVFTDQDRAVATGNVVVVQAGNRIAADRVDFNTKTKLGTFYQAYGFANIKPTGAAAGRDRAAHGLQPGNRRVFPGRDHRKDRPQEVSDHERAASRPACSRRRAGSSTPGPSC